MPTESSILPLAGDSVRATSRQPVGAPSRAARQSASVRLGSPDLPQSWQEAIKTAVRDGQWLCAALTLDPQSCGFSPIAAHSFPVFAPWELIRRMEPGEPNDPLLRQVLAIRDEEHSPPGFADDPVGDESASL